MFEQRISLSEGHEPSKLDWIDPTPEEIEERSAEIRRGWSARVREKRKVHNAGSWRPPFVMTIELVRQLNGIQE